MADWGSTTETFRIINRTLAERFALSLSEKFPDMHFAVSPGGRKYARITDRPSNGSGAYAHAFVDLTTGDLLMPAGWSGPAKGARGNLSTPEGFADAVGRADRYGSYLYCR